jgi:hypothetical protein
MRKCLVSWILLWGFLSLSADECYWEPFAPCELVPSYFETVRLEGSWFYWTVDGDQFAYASKKTSTILREKQRFYDVNFGAAPGYKIGLAVQSVPMWGEFLLSWTHQDCHSSNHHVINGKEGKTIFINLVTLRETPQTINAGEQAIIKGKGTWRYEVYEASYGLMQWWGAVALKPYVGMRILDSHQYLKARGNFVNSSPINYEKDRVHVKDQGIGPVVGLDLRIPVCGCWAIFGKGAGAVLWNCNAIKEKCTTGYVDGSVAKASLREFQKLGRPMLDLEIGVEWLLPLSEKMQPLLRVSWESHTLFNSFRYYKDQLPQTDSEPFLTMRKTKGFVTTSGITLTGQVNF